MYCPGRKREPLAVHWSIPYDMLMQSRLGLRSRALAVALTVLVAVGNYGCAAGSHRIVQQPALGLLQGAPAISWFAPAVARDLSSLERWRRSVGPPVLVHARTIAPSSDHVLVVSWNLHVGSGDLRGLFTDIRREAGPDVPIVFLLQEAYRSGPEVPRLLGREDIFASVIRGPGQDGRREEIESAAQALGLFAYYVPSMRNGGPLTSDEDRGNAILSTVPLTELTAIELPFERQRRVAIAATVAGTRRDGTPWRLRVASAHLDNLLGARRFWVMGSEFGRARQARGLAAALGNEPDVVLGADLNTWFGFHDRAYTEMARAFPDTQVTDRRATFRGLLRLDHLFFRLQDGRAALFRRVDGRYDSDHYPLIGTIRFTPF